MKHLTILTTVILLMATFTAQAGKTVTTIIPGKNCGTTIFTNDDGIITTEICCEGTQGVCYTVIHFEEKPNGGGNGNGPFDQLVIPHVGKLTGKLVSQQVSQSGSGSNAVSTSTIGLQQ